MKKLVFYFLLLTMVFFSYQLVSAEEFDIVSPEKISSVASELNLTKDQIKQLEELRDKTKRDIVKLRNDMMVIKMDIKDEIKKDSPDKVKLDSIIDKMTSTQNQITKIRLSNLLESKKILSAEQYIKLKDFIASHKGKMSKRLLNNKNEN